MRTLVTIAFLLINIVGIAQDKSTIICGQFAKKFLSTISINVSGLLDERPTNYLAFVDTTNGIFRFDFPMVTTQEINLEADKQVNLILSPGDSLFIKFNKDGRIEFSGTNSEVNQEILNYSLIKKKETFKPNCEGKTLTEYKRELTEWTQKELRELEEFETKNNYSKQSETWTKNNYSKQFETWTKNDILYRNANFLINYAHYKTMNNLYLEKELMDNKIFPVDNDQALVSLFYRSHLNQYLVFKYRFYKLIPNKKENYNNFKNLQNRLDSLIAVEKATKSRDILVIDLFNTLLKKDLSNAANFIDLNINKIQTKELRELFINRVETLKATTNRTVTFLGEQNANSKIIGDIFRDMNERFHGKVIYVDFWATWCGPCRSEFPYSISLDKSFKGIGVAFVYVCMDSEIEKWRSSIKNLKLNENQYFLNEVESKMFRQKFQIQAFPTYYLIDKTGGLIDKDAPRPSSEDIKDKIQTLVER